MLIIENFDQVTKISFDQTPKLLENFDQLKMSSEFRSNDPLSTTTVCQIINAPDIENQILRITYWRSNSTYSKLKINLIV
jgi:hypothetical protein